MEANTVMMHIGTSLQLKPLESKVSYTPILIKRKSNSILRKDVCKKMSEAVLNWLEDGNFFYRDDSVIRFFVISSLACVLALAS